MDDKTAPPDDLDYRNPPGTRVTYQARQRATDRTTWLHLALHLPAFLLSLALVLAAALVLEAWLGVPAWLPTALWTASGALTFHRPSEQFLARHLLRLHRPLPADLATLTPVWHEVTARAGVDGRQYELWIEESSDLNALAAMRPYRRGHQAGTGATAHHPAGRRTRPRTGPPRGRSCLVRAARLVVRHARPTRLARTRPSNAPAPAHRARR